MSFMPFYHSHKKYYIECGRLLMSIFGTFLFSFGTNVFIEPICLYNGGFVGLAQIIRTLLIDYGHFNFGSLDIAGTLYFIFNIPMFFIAYKFMGKQFFLKTMCCIFSMTAFLTLIPKPMIPIINDPLTACFIGGLIAGGGIGLTLRGSASGGGSDILSIYFARKSNFFTVGKITLLINLIIYGLCLFLFDISIVIYSIIYVSIFSIATDKLHAQNICIEIMIFTKADTNQMLTYILDDLYRGSSYWQAKGGYTNEDSNIIYTIISKHELGRLKRKISEIDPYAFVVAKENVTVVDGNFIRKL